MRELLFVENITVNGGPSLFVATGKVDRVG